jgi:hypothetical protein
VGWRSWVSYPDVEFFNQEALGTIKTITKKRKTEGMKSNRFSCFHDEKEL